jgi:thioredoxin-dependent peroxiredoxin
LGGLRDTWFSFSAAGAVVYGVNPASAERHRLFMQKLDLPFPLIVDKGGRVSRVFRAGFGPVIRRTVYIIDPEGKVAFARRGAPPVEEMLAIIQQPRSSTP